MKMPFGRHKGKELEKIIEEDTGYFIWLTNIELHGKLKEEVEKLAVVYDVDICQYVSDQEEMRHLCAMAVGDEWWKY